MKRTAKKSCIVFLLAILLVKSSITGIGAADIRNFVDVRWHWAYNDISFCSERELMLGVSGNRFAPDDTLTRGMFCTVLYRLWSHYCIITEGDTLKRGLVVSGTSSFRDVKNGDWYEKGIVWAKKNGLVNGYTDGTFDPNGQMNRTQMAVILNGFCRELLRISDSESKTNFKDESSIPPWGLTAARNVTAIGLISGTDSGLFQPDGTVTRAMAASVVHRLWDKTEEILMQSNYITGENQSTVFDEDFQKGNLASRWIVSEKTTAVKIDRKPYVQKLSENAINLTNSGLFICSSYENSILYSGEITQIEKYPCDGTLWKAEICLPQFGGALETKVSLSSAAEEFTAVRFSPWNNRIDISCFDVKVSLTDKDFFQTSKIHSIAFYSNEGTVFVYVDGALCTSSKGVLTGDASVAIGTFFSDGNGIVFPSTLPETTTIKRIQIFR